MAGPFKGMLHCIVAVSASEKHEPSMTEWK